MNVLFWLRKLGILRFGGEAAVYTNAKDRPLSMQDSSVFDSRRDVWTLETKPSATPETVEQKKGERS
jgi:hypothetical protein